ncbi:MAG: shikimate dehydrogenase family protein [Rickettsiales bacterium]
MNRTKEKALSFTTLSNKVEVVEWSEAPDGLSETDLLVNTTSLGMEGQPELVLSIDALPSHAVVTDIVYSPLHTPLLLKAKARNLHTVDGLGMLLYQAQMAFFHWFGVMPDCDHTLREYVLNTLEQA